MSQTKIKPIVAVSERFSINNLLIELLGTRIQTVGPHAGTFGEIGINLETKKIEYSILGSYGVEFVLGEEKYMSHLVGLGLKFHFLKERKIGFLLSLNSHYQLSSNYSLAYMREGGYLDDKPDSYVYPSGSHGGPPYLTSYFSRFYISTPFIGNVLAGVTARLFNDFYINFSAGFGIRITKTKYAEWSEFSNFNKYVDLKNVPKDTYNFATIDFELRVIYAIPINRRK